MAINATNSGGGDYTPVPGGTYVARCIAMHHIGTVPENIMGKEKKLNKVRITWELPDELKEFKEGEGEKPYVISKEFTLSMNEKANLRKFLEGWRSKGFTELEAKSFDITKLLEVPAMITVVHKTSKSGRVYADVASVSKLPKNMKCPPQVNPTFELNYDDHWSEEAFNKLPDFLKDKMRTSDEYKAIHHPENMDIVSSEELEDDENGGLPF